MLTIGALLLTSNSQSAPARKPLWAGVALGMVIIACGMYVLRADYLCYKLSELPRNHPLAELIQAQERAAAAMPHSALPYTLAASQTTNTNAAFNWLTQAAKIAPQDPFIHLKLMQLHLAKNQHRLAQESLEEARKRFPNTWLLEGTPDEVAERLRAR